MIKETERLDSLECNNLKIIQDKSGYTFTMDSVLLANYAKVEKDGKVVDLGTGSGVIPILLSYKTKAKEIIGIEIQPRLYDMAKRSVALNELNEKINILNIDMKDAPDILGKESFDTVTVNPPYSKYDKNPLEATETDICKYEVLITLNDVINVCSKLLKYGGKLFIIIKAARITDLLTLMRNYNIEPKRITPVQPTPSKALDTIIVEGRKKGNIGLVFDKPLIVLDENGEYTKELKRIYKNEL